MEYEYNDKRRFVKYKTAAKRYDVSANFRKMGKRSRCNL